MGGFVSLIGSPADAARLDRLLRSPPADWRADLIEPGWLVLRSRRCPPPLRRLSDQTLVVGDLFTRRRHVPATNPPSASSAFESLLADAWGGYVAIRRAEGPGHGVLRDPSGNLEAAVWRRDGVWGVASELPGWLDPWLPRDIGLDPTGIAGLLAAPTLAAGPSPLTGIEALAPGATWLEGDIEQVWRPRGFAHRPRWRGRNLERELVACVDEVVAALGHGRVLVEISGGLDSAIVAGALRATGAEIVGAVNYFVEDAEGDERPYARDVARGLGLELTEVRKPRIALDLHALAAASRGLRPASWALDQHHDADLADRCGALGAEAIFTGQGGDNVFFQTPTPLIAADGPGAGLTPGTLADLARWQGRSVYGVTMAAIHGLGRSPLEVPGADMPHLGPVARAMSGCVRPHPWLSGIGGLAAAKQLQIASLVGGLGAHGPTLRGQVADLRRPLLSQPLLELCLSIPTLQLTRGGRDRGLARSAFAGRAPASVVGRRAKGRLSAHYGRIIGLSLADLRPLLLDGRLVAEGLLDPVVLDGMLRVESLIWRGGLGVIVQALLVELWVREWEGRLGRLPAARGP